MSQPIDELKRRRNVTADACYDRGILAKIVSEGRSSLTQNRRKLYKGIPFFGESGF